jgi:hypothetical protein
MQNGNNPTRTTKKERMKKIFGVLSLIAILTVSFTLQASANGIDNNVEFVVSVDYPSIEVAVATVEVPTVFEFINVTDNSVNYIASGEGVDIPDIDSRDSAINLNNFSVTHLPFEVGLLSEASYKNTISPNLNEYIKDYNYTYGSEAPDIVSRISSNIGKFTKYNI